MIELTVDKENENVCYNDRYHIYWDKKDLFTYISATTIIGLYEQPFNRDFWLDYKTFQRICNPDKDILYKLRSLMSFDYDILKKEFGFSDNEFKSVRDEIESNWKNTNKESCESGTRIHSRFETKFNEEGYYSLEWYGFNGDFYYKPNLNTFLSNKKLQAIPEMLISMKTKSGVRIAGQIDLAVKNENTITVIDYKGLYINTPIYRKRGDEVGFCLMKNLKVGDLVYDMDMKWTRINAVSSVHINPCYSITFRCGKRRSTLICDHEHKWRVHNGKREKTVEAKELYEMFVSYSKSENKESYGSKAFTVWSRREPNGKYIPMKIISISKTETVPTVCISVESKTHVYLAGYDFVPTHNTNKKLNFESYKNPNGQYAMMKDPLSSYMDCNYSHYKLQVSLYSYMLSRIYTEAIIENPRIFHIAKSMSMINKLSINRHTVDYIKDDVIRMCRDFRDNHQEYEYTKIIKDSNGRYWLPSKR